MSSTILEQIRSNHEMAEYYESAIGSILDETAQGVSFCIYNYNTKYFYIPIDLF
jgi:hypothetical protein